MNRTHRSNPGCRPMLRSESCRAFSLHTIGLAALTVILLGCERRTGLARVTDDATMRDSLLALTPPGTPIAVARATMTRRGFTCMNHRDTTIGTRADPDSIMCSQNIDVGVIRTLQWRTALVHGDGVVTDVLVLHHVEGP